MTEIERFESERSENIRRMAQDPAVRALSRQCLDTIAPFKYAYNFSWMGRPIIQFPQDMVAMQEIIWQTRPRVIVETGVAHGGSLVYYS
jgi:cephalosporin hydroxylase